MKHFREILSALVLAVLILGVTTSSLTAIPDYGRHVYYGVVVDAPYAPYTTLKATSLLPYYSVVADAPYAPYTTLKATSLLPYYSVLH